MYVCCRYRCAYVAGRERGGHGRWSNAMPSGHTKQKLKAVGTILYVHVGMFNINRKPYSQTTHPCHAMHIQGVQCQSQTVQVLTDTHTKGVCSHHTLYPVINAMQMHTSAIPTHPPAPPTHGCLPSIHGKILDHIIEGSPSALPAPDKVDKRHTYTYQVHTYIRM